MKKEEEVFYWLREPGLVFLPNWDRLGMSNRHHLGVMMQLAVLSPSSEQRGDMGNEFLPLPS